MNEEKKELSLVVEKNKDYRTIPATGVWGGPTPDASSIIAYFYVESNALPNIINIKADEMGTFDPNKGESIMRGDLVREIQAAIVLTPQNAVSIGKWLIENGQMLLDTDNRNMY